MDVTMVDVLKTGVKDVSKRIIYFCVMKDSTKDDSMKN
jgi:hypothetical protein